MVRESHHVARDNSNPSGPKGGHQIYEPWTVIEDPSEAGWTKASETPPVLLFENLHLKSPRRSSSQHKTTLQKVATGLERIVAGVGTLDRYILRVVER